MGWTSHQRGTFGPRRQRVNSLRRKTRAPRRPFMELLEDRVLMAAGDLDTSFGTGGLVDTNVAKIQASYNNANASAVLVDPNGDIIAAGAFNNLTELGAVRYLPNGNIDTSFGSNGVAIVSTGSSLVHAEAAAQQPDGKIIVAGDSRISGVQTAFTLVRFNADGSLDTTFGNSGVVTTVVAAGYSSTAYAVTVQPNGAILAIGYTEGFAGNSFAVVRYNANGSLDTTFGAGGIVTTTRFYPSGNESADAVALQQNDDIVVAGTSGGHIALARYNTNGTLDTTFGTAGLVNGDIGSDGAIGVVIQPNGQIVVAALSNSPQGYELRRYNANGTIDTTFGTNGSVIENDGAFLADPTAVALQPDGKILVTGAVLPTSGYQFGTARFTSNGALDSTFGTGGFAVTGFGSTFSGGSDDTAYAIALQVDGGIVVAGSANGGGTIGIARYVNDFPAPNPLVVTNTNDSGIGSLRWAITNADEMSGPNTITFDIPGPAPYTILPLSALPAIYNATTIDGTSEPGYAGTPLVQLSGQDAGPSVAGIALAAGGSGVKGLAINGFSSSGISVVASGSVLIQGNYLGTDPTGTLAVGNGGGGISVEAVVGPPLAVTIGGTTAAARNVISGNTNSDGISIAGAFVNGTLIEGNDIGTDVTGKIALPNYTGILVNNAALNTTIGGTATGAGNLISGNAHYGIAVTNLGGSASGTLVEGNLIGTDISGSLGLGNGAAGIEINSAPDNTVGGIAAGARNVISGNGQDGILITGAGASGNWVAGNYMGTDATGKVAVPNAVGVLVQDGPSNTTIGGTATGAGNLISGNTAVGIDLFAEGSVSNGTLIEGNLIGTDVTGNQSLSNVIGIQVLSAPGTTIGGTIAAARNVISGNTTTNIASTYGITVEGPSAIGTLIEGNYLGTNSAGTASLANGGAVNPSGDIAIGLGAANTTIGGTVAGAGNLIAAAGDFGIGLENIDNEPATGTLIEGNQIGTDVTGTKSLAGAGISGIEIDASAGVTVGGTAVGAGNLIAGSASTGILIAFQQTNGILIQGNLVGTDITGTKALGVPNGIVVDSDPTGVTIGGTSAGAGNLISGCVAGISLNTGTEDSLIQGNLIGTDITGTIVIGNSGVGLGIFEGSNNTIGGTVPGAANVIAGTATTYANTGDGIKITESTDNLVEGNFIGTNAAGANLTNAANGIELQSSSGNTIGGTSAGAGNVIAFNGKAGVKIDTAAGNGQPYSVNDTVEGNSIYANGALGISLSPSGVTLNHVGGPVPGSNNLQNYPVLTSASSSANGTTIQGTLNGAASTTYQLEFFANATTDASGYGEGQTYLGSWPVTTDSTGNVTFAATFPSVLPLGQYVLSATATDPNGDTSEFSQDLVVPQADLAVSMTATPGPVAVGTDATFVVTITNNGPNTAPTASIADTLSGALNVVSVTPSTGGTYTQSGNAITANFGSLASGATATLTIAVSPSATGSISDAATVMGAVYDPDFSNNSTSQTITAESAGTLSFSAASYTTSDTSGSETITVDRTGGAGGTVTVQYATSDGTAKAGNDYTATTGTLTFPAGVTSETFTVPILDDQTPDGTESLNLALSNPTEGATLGTPSTAVLNLTDVPGAFQFSSPTYSVSESGGTATITVTRADGDGGAVSVHYATSNGTAVAGTDYTATSGTLDFPDGVDSESFTIPILDNPNPSGNVTVDLALSNAVGGATVGSPDAAVLTIVQGAGSLQFSQPTYSVAENGGTVTVTVTRSYGTAGVVTVNYATSNGTAVAGADYTATSGTLNFPAGATSETFTIPVLDNPNPSGNVTVDLALTDPTGGAALGSPSTAILTIDQGAGDLQFSAPTYSVAENGGTATITVTRTYGTAGAVSVNYATSNDTAVAGTDYTAKSGTLNFPAGIASETFTIPILDNPNPSGNVTVDLALTSPTGGAAIGTTNSAVLTINEGAGEFQFSAPTYSALDNALTATITVTRTYGTAGAVTVDYATSDGTAKAGTDYTSTTGTLNFAAGVSSQTFTIPIIDDTNPDGTEAVNLALSSPTGGASLGSQSTAVLDLTDIPGALQFSAASYTVDQNSGTATFTVTRTLGDGGPASVNYATSDGTARAGTDYTATSGTLNFPDGVATESFTVPILDDPHPNGADTFNLTLSNPTGGATLGSVTQAVATFQDVPGTLQFSNATYQVSKDGGAATITVTRAVGDGGPITVDYTTSGGSAATGVEYTPTSGTLSFPDGVTSQSFNIPIINDPHPDGTQTVGLVLSNPTGGASLGTQADALLTINDTPGALQFSAATYNVQESSNTATITVTRALGDGGPVSVNYATSDGTAKAGTAYTSASGTLSFPDGVTTETFTVPILPGGVTTGSQSLQLTLTNPIGGASLGTQATATLDIATPPGTLQFSDAIDSVNANNTAIILTITRTGGSGGSVAVNYATTDGTASAGTDYTNTNGTLVLSDGRTTQTLTIPILSNPNRSGSVSFNVTLSDPAGGASLGSVTTDTVTIVDNVVASPPNAPQLTAQSDTGVSNTDGLTRDNGSTAAPLVFTVTGVSPPNGFVQLENVTNPASPVPLGSPVQASGGTAYITLAGAATTLADGTYQIAATTAATATGTPTAASPSTPITIQTALHVTSFNPASNFLTALPNNQIVVTFNHWLAGLTPDKADGSGFTKAPFAVMLVPGGPDGLATQKLSGALWSAPSGYDAGDLPIPATAVYHQNADGTATITLTPHEPLATDVYLVTVNSLTDLAGNTLTNTAGQGGAVYTSFDYRPDPTTSSALNVVSVTTLNGTVPINNNTIPQPDTIGIRFNKPVDQYTVNGNTVQLFGGGALIPAAVAYSPSTDTAYLTPETALNPGTVYYVAVSGSVADDGQFPNPGITLGQAYVTSFHVNAAGVGVGHGPLQVTATTPANNTVWPQPFGYGAVTFSEPIDLNAMGRFAAMLIPQTGGVTTGTSGYADVPYNAKLAFNPNTRQLIIVPTGYVTNNVVQLISLTGIKAQNGDPLTAAPGQSLPVYATFLLSASAPPHVIAASDTTIAVANTSVIPSQPATRDVVRVHPRPADRPVDVPVARRVPMGPLASWRRERGW